MGRLEQVPDAPREVALEAADCFLGALALRAFASDVVLRFGVAAQAGDGDAVESGVDLAIAAAVQAVSVGLGGADRDRRDAGGPGELASLEKRLAPATSPTSLAAVKGPKPGSVNADRLRPAVAARVVERLRCCSNDARAASGMDDQRQRAASRSCG